MVAASAFGRLLRRLRVEAGLTQESLAEQAGLSSRTISDLERGLATAPRRSTLALLSDGLQLDPAQRQHLANAARVNPGSARPLHNLPAHLTSFIGRGSELSALRELLAQPGTRLVTLTGAGGTGKTRLGQRIAEELAPRFADGCVFVPIAPAADLPAATSLLASTLGVSEEVGESLEATLIDHLRDRHLLLFLDGFEHLAEDAPFVSRLLGACPELTVLVTSRVCLRIAGEQEFPVAPLPVPDLTPPLRAESLAVCDSVALFVDRAARASPDFALTEDNAGVVGSICVRLEGLPLALELAARRIKLLHPRALLAQLEGPGPSLRLLTGGGPDLPRRQRTLRETIKWSYDLLSDHEQHVLRRMAVFMHSADLDAIGAVCGFATEADGAEDRVNVIDALGALVDHSLVSRREGPAGQARFAMLDTIREFAQERLAASGEDADMRERHARYFIEVVETAGPVLLGAADHAAVVAAEQGNMQAALRWLVAAG